MRIGRLAARVATLLLALGGRDAAAANLLVNPTFDADREDWSETWPPEHGQIAQFHHTTSEGFPAPGAVGCTNSRAAADTSMALYSAPVPVPFGLPLVFGAYCRIPAGQSRTGGCIVGVSFRDSNDQLLTSALAGLATEPGDWKSLAVGVPIYPPVGTTTAQLFLRVFKHEAGGDFGAYLDDAYLGTLGTKGDLGGDGKPDLILHGADGDNRIWRMDGATRLGSELIDQPAGTAAIVGSDDFDLDGRSDLVLREFFTSSISFWFMDGAHVLGSAPLSATPLPSAAWTVAATGDFDHDGRADLLWRNSTTQQLLVWTLSGIDVTGTIVPSPDHAVDSNWSVAAALDFDNDGNRDLLWYNATSGKIVIWRMDANVVRLSGEFTSPDSAGANNWKVRAGGDYGLGPGGVPGSNDIVWRNSTSGKFVIWHMDPGSVPLTRTSGEFTSPDAPAGTPTDWNIVGPK